MERQIFESFLLIRRKQGLANMLVVQAQIFYCAEFNFITDVLVSNDYSATFISEGQHSENIRTRGNLYFYGYPSKETMQGNGFNVDSVLFTFVRFHVRMQIQCPKTNRIPLRPVREAQWSEIIFYSVRQLNLFRSQLGVCENAVKYHVLTSLYRVLVVFQYCT